MKVEFREEFSLPVEDVYGYFQSPADWVRLYGFAGGVKDCGDGWYAIALHRFPFPLVARNTEQVPNELVRRAFRGFWRGRGEVRFFATETGVRVEGSEEISVRWLSLFSPVDIDSVAGRANEATSQGPQSVGGSVRERPPL